MLSWHNVSCHLVLPHNRRATVFAGSKDEKDRRNETILLEVSLGLSHFLLRKERVSHLLTQLPERSYTPSRQNLRSLLPCSTAKHSPQGTAERATRYKVLQEHRANCARTWPLDIWRSQMNSGDVVLLTEAVVSTKGTHQPCSAPWQLQGHDLDMGLCSEVVSAEFSGLQPLLPTSSTFSFFLWSLNIQIF